MGLEIVAADVWLGFVAGLCGHAALAISDMIAPRMRHPKKAASGPNLSAPDLDVTPSPKLATKPQDKLK